MDTKPSLKTRLYLSLISRSELWTIIYFCFPSSFVIFISFRSLISLETVACVTLKPSFISLSARSSCVSISNLLINSIILFCLAIFNAVSPLYIHTHFFPQYLQKAYFIQLYNIRALSGTAYFYAVLLICLL